MDAFHSQASLGVLMGVSQLRVDAHNAKMGIIAMIMHALSAIHHAGHASPVMSALTVRMISSSLTESVCTSVRLQSAKGHLIPSALNARSGTDQRVMAHRVSLMQCGGSFSSVSCSLWW